MRSLHTASIRSRWMIVATVAFLACDRHGPDRSGTNPLAPPSAREVFGGSVPDRLGVVLDTGEGAIHCVIEPNRAPRAAALFVGLARGGFAWRDPRNGTVTTRRFYDGLTFFRTLPDLFVQSGCPLGDGNGHPGYRVPMETHDDDAERLARAGALFFATYTPPPMRRDPSPPPPGHVIGSQFGIGLTDMSHLAGRTTVLGACRDLDVVRRISRRANGERVVLRTVRVE